MWASYSGKLYSSMRYSVCMQRLQYQAVAIAKPVSPILWRSKSSCAAMVCKFSWPMGSGQAMATPWHLVVLNGLPIIPEIVVLNRFIGVVLKIYCSMVSCKSTISNLKSQIKNSESGDWNQKSKMNLKTGIWKLRISKLKCENWHLKSETRWLAVRY